MKTFRMVIGIISMVLFAVIAFQSCAVGLGNTLMDNGESSGSAGILLAILMLVAGIVAVAAKKSKGGTITAGCFYLFGGIVAIVNTGNFPDLMIWSILALAFGAAFLISGILQKKGQGAGKEESK